MRVWSCGNRYWKTWVVVKFMRMRQIEALVMLYMEEFQDPKKGRDGAYFIFNNSDILMLVKEGRKAMAGNLIYVRGEGYRHRP